MTALTRMVSAIFRRPYDSSFVVEELKAVFDPTFSAFIGGKPVPSLVAAIGGVIERHMKSIGYPDTLHDSAPAFPPVPYEAAGQESDTGNPGSDYTGLAQPARVVAASELMTMPYGTAHDFGAICPACFSRNTKNESGCLTCRDCGHSKCN
jgi:ribonucleoside-diphosphate reductase alpha chain